MSEATVHTRAYRHGPATRPVIDDVTFSAAPREVITITGASEYGKPTLLRCTAGLARPGSGQMTLGGAPVTGFPGRLAAVFQEYPMSRYPWLTVVGNVAPPLRRRLPGRRDRRAAVIAALDSASLVGSAVRHPRQMSGGMQQ